MSTIEIPESLFVDGWLTGIEHIVSSGKEGTVYCCTASSRIDAEHVAVKVYRPRDIRSFKNDAIYSQGRALNVFIDRGSGMVKPAGRPDERLNRAIRKHSAVGKRASESSWTHHEYATLAALHRIGARVPRPYTATNSAIVMDYVGAPGAPAPQLKEIDLSPPEAAAVFATLLEEIELWLAYERIHGDLSPFNVLYWDQRLTVIDFPQAINPYENPLASSMLERDVRNVCKYFERFSALPEAQDPGAIARAMWRRSVQRPWW